MGWAPWAQPCPRCQPPQKKCSGPFEALTPRILTRGGSHCAPPCQAGPGNLLQTRTGIKQPLAPSLQPAQGTGTQRDLAGATKGTWGWHSRAQECPGPCWGCGDRPRAVSQGCPGLSPCHLSPFLGSHLGTDRAPAPALQAAEPGPADNPVIPAPGPFQRHCQGHPEPLPPSLRGPRVPVQGWDSEGPSQPSRAGLSLSCSVALGMFQGKMFSGS